MWGKQVNLSGPELGEGLREGFSVSRFRPNRKVAAALADDTQRTIMRGTQGSQG